MKKLLAIALVCVLASTANAAVIKLVGPDGGMHGAADPLVLAPSETATVSIQIDVYSYTYFGITYSEQVRAANIFMDSVDLGEFPEHENMEIIDVLRAGSEGFVWSGIRAFNVAPMDLLEFAPLPPDGSGAVDWDGYYLVADMAAEGPYLSGPDGAGFNTYVLDTITIHCTDISDDTIWFENFATFQGLGSPRTPQIVDGSLTDYGISKLLGAETYGALGFENGFIQDQGAPKTWFDREGFYITQIPEPASLALLAIGGLALLRRK